VPESYLRPYCSETQSGQTGQQVDPVESEHDIEKKTSKGFRKFRLRHFPEQRFIRGRTPHIWSVWMKSTLHKERYPKGIRRDMKLYSRAILALTAADSWSLRKVWLHVGLRLSAPSRVELLGLSNYSANLAVVIFNSNYFGEGFWQQMYRSRIRQFGNIPLYEPSQFHLWHTA
jgi:hypothetical protein